MAWRGLVPFVTLAVLGALALAAAWLAGRRSTTGPATMSFWGHVGELRRRLLRIAAAFLSALVVALVLRIEEHGGWPVPVLSMYDPIAAQLFRAMADHLVPDGVTLVTLGALDAFSAQLSTGLAIATVVALPTALWELGVFIGPGLRAQEKRLLRFAVFPAMLLFAAGALFAYFVILPTTLEALYAFATPLGAVPLLSLSDLASFTLAFLVGVGLAFQAPIVMAALSRVGLVSPAAFVRKWRHAVLVILFVSMVVTPDPTIVSQLLLGLPLIALYLVGIGAAYWAAPRKAP